MKWALIILVTSAWNGSPTDSVLMASFPNQAACLSAKESVVMQRYPIDPIFDDAENHPWMHEEREIDRAHARSHLICLEIPE